MQVDSQKKHIYIYTYASGFAEIAYIYGIVQVDSYTLLYIIFRAIYIYIFCAKGFFGGTLSLA